MVLPSYLKRKRGSEGSSGQKKRSRESAQVWDRDIVCIPKADGEASPISFPRGKSRAKLAAKRLIGKIRLTSTMSENEMEKEVRSVFKCQMHNREDFPFVFLQCTGAGSKSLSIPSKSATFTWTPQQVAKLGNSKSPIYILAQDELACSDVEVRDLCIDILVCVLDCTCSIPFFT